MQKFNSYNELIDYAKSQNRSKKDNCYYEKHHIVPKHAGGTDNKSNLVLLTIYKHVYAHYLLSQEYPEYRLQNLNACLIIIHPKKTYKKKLEVILDWLQNKEAIKLTEKIKKEWIDCVKSTPSPLRGRTCNYFKHYWIQKNNQKPLAVTDRKLKKYLSNSYKLIDKCPICGKENSEENWCCCYEHLKIFEKERKKNASKAQSEFLKNDWAKENSSRKNMKKVKGGPSKGERTWVHKGDEIISIKSSELDYYKSLGYERGRIHTYVEKVKKPKEKREFVKLYNNGEIVDENEFNKVQYRQQYFMICSDCGKKVSKIKRGNFQKFSPYCPICGRKHTNLKRFGATSPAGSKEVQEKMKKTCLERYGSEYLMQCKELMEKAQKTKNS